MRLVPACLIGLATLLLAALPLAVSAQTFPAPTGRVTDAAGIIPDDLEARLTQKLAALEQQSGPQFVVATIPDLQGSMALLMLWQGAHGLRMPQKVDTGIDLITRENVGGFLAALARG